MRGDRQKSSAGHGPPSDAADEATTQLKQLAVWTWWEAIEPWQTQLDIAPDHLFAYWSSASAWHNQSMPRFLQPKNEMS